MKEEIKELRVRIDGLSQLVKELSTLKGIYWRAGITHEVESSYDSLILAKAWLGKVLSELGEESPYKAGKKTIEDIESTADVAVNYQLISSRNPTYWIVQNGKELTNHIEKVDWLREEIQKLVRDTDYITSQKGRFYIYGLRVEQYLCEARFWLGFELQRIKNENK